MSSEIFILRKIHEILHFYGFRHYCWYFWFKPSRFKLIRTIKNLIFISKCRFDLLNMNLSTLCHFPTRPVADLRGAQGTPPGAQILSISCSFWENLAKLYVGAPTPGSWRPLLGEILDPPLKALQLWVLF